MILQGKKATVIIAILLLTTIFFMWKYVAVQSELALLRAQVEKPVFNEDMLNFTGLFIEKVLKAEKEVSFEERLNLETVVRGLKDDEILEQWNKFVNSKTEAEAQNAVKNLLGMLVKKIKG